METQCGTPMRSTQYVVAEVERWELEVPLTWFHVTVGVAFGFAVLGMVALAMWFLYYRKKARNPR